MASRLTIVALCALIAVPAFAANTQARLQTTDKRGLICNFPVALASVVSVTFTLLGDGTDADPSGMQVGSASLQNGTYNGSSVTNGATVVVVDPDVDAIDRDGNSYQVSIVAADSGGMHYTCDGGLLIENETVPY